MQARDDRLRYAGRCPDAAPRVQHQVLAAERLVQRRHPRQDRQPMRRRHGQRTHRARRQWRHCSRGNGKTERRIASDQRRNDLDRSLVRNVNHIDAHRIGERGTGKMRGAADPARCVIQRTGRVPCGLRHVRHGAIGRACLHHHYLRAEACADDMRERRGIELDGRLHQLLRDMCRCADHQRVAIGRLLRKHFGSEDAARADLVLDDHGLPQFT